MLALLRHGDDLPGDLIPGEATHTAAGQRWADLLRCEQLAGRVLRAHGCEAALSEIIETEGRVFLQSTRFDRTPEGGRRGYISLAALDAAYYGHGRIDWWAFAPQLQRDGWIGTEDAQRLSLNGRFGALIGNTDMHPGNAGLILSDARPLTLAPSYDMLPMAWRSSTHGEVVEREVRIPLPTPEQQRHWRQAATMALDFWQQVEATSEISAEFRHIAGEMKAQLQRAVVRFG